MAANPIKTNSTQGLYLTEEEDGSIAGNTPGEIDLTNLVLGNSYIYFDTILRFEEKSTFNQETGFTGLKTWQIDAAGGVQSSTGGGRKNFFMITIETDETNAEHLKTFVMLNVKIGDGLKYIVKQTASEAFEQFANSVGTLRKAAAIIIRGIDIVEIANSGKDVKVINIACEQIKQRET